jgi:hypothetical protein
MLCHTLRVVTLVALVLGSTASAFAQAKPVAAADPPPEPATLLDRIKEPDQGGGLHFTKHWAVVFGGIKSGSGAALGPAFSNKFENGAYFQVKALYSIRRFRLVQVRYDTQPFWGGRGLLINRIRFQDAPKLDLYALGPDSPDLNVDYAERRSDATARLRLQLTPALRMATGFGIERYSTNNGRIDLVNDPALAPQPIMPGLGTKPWYAHSFVSGALDSRLSPDYSRRGHLVEGTIHSFNDVNDGQPAFGRFEGVAEKLIPMHQAKGVLDVSAQAWLSLSSGARSVPFYLMPTLGGSSYLMAYPSYRYRDRHAVSLRGEYRWAVHKMIDVAGVAEIGTVAPRVGDLSFSDAPTSFAAGIRVHTKTASLVNLDLAHGREGFRFVLGFSSGGS